jgi:hypothetical protein
MDPIGKARLDRRFADSVFPHFYSRNRFSGQGIVEK